MLQRLSEIKDDLLTPSILLPSMAQGLIIGIMLVIIESSFANMIFAGSLSNFSAQATGLLIFGAMMMTLVTGVTSSFKGVVTLPQDIPAAIFVGIASTLMITMGSQESQEQFSTLVVLMMLSGVFTGLCFFVMGLFKLSNLVRFLPFPVVGGFLAGCGLLLCLGGLGVMTGVSPGLETLESYAQGQVFYKWLLGVGFALGLFALLKLRPHFLILPGALVLGIGAFFLGLAVLGIDASTARQGGWLVGSLPSGGLWPAFTPDDFAYVDWGVVLTQLPNVMIVALLATIALLLNMGGIELGARADLDMDKELFSGAAANLLGGLGGGFAGYAALSLSLLSHRTGVGSRLVSIFGALVCLMVVFVGAEVLTFFPKPILGSLLFLLGLFFFDDWIFSGWKKLTVVDFGIVVAIIAAIAWFGFLEGVGLGLLLAIFIFIFRFSRVSVIRKELTGADVSSQVERPVAARILLGQHADEIRVIMLDGYVFFGSACFLAQRVGALLKADHSPRFIVIDMGAIDGFDISAVNNFLRIAQQAQNGNVKLLMSRVPDRLWELFKRNSTPDVLDGVSLHNHLELALERCENEILQRECDAMNRTGDSDRLFHQAYDELDSHLQSMERFEAVLESVQHFAHEEKVSQGSTIVKVGQSLNGVYLVVWGTVGEYMEQDEQEIRLRLVGRGNVVVPQGILSDRVSAVTVRADENCVLAFIPRDAMEKFAQREPAQALRLYELLLSMATSTY
ncbi:SulP family inorganic anion transporter [Desulfovibrio ferrophilus]|uniref:Sulphate transporter n=1 Tax=Desulfovibrio ferrophilus TaxID=241368 RepID=A0A2Z6AWA4_9BACT|nr:SulP family inorganic anion transporter [Desulfovibrio ferrophilus]BBD07522.1 sulphate transporter [Desulfovibrio ferrophilus]